jgi:hypothetical protein
MQAREFFRNSDAAANSVKPLLTFYGVASLVRALTLLLRRDGGEECLATRFHVCFLLHHFQAETNTRNLA